jgi:hypothetical protein
MPSAYAPYTPRSARAASVPNTPFRRPTAHPSTPMPQWQRLLRRLALESIRRPLLTLTMGIVLILLGNAVAEANAAGQIQMQVEETQRTNATLQLQLTQTAQEIQSHQSQSAIISAAQKLGWVLPTPTAQP